MAEKSGNTEERVQIAIVNYIKLQYPNTLFTATMGGQFQKHFSQRLKAKRTGYLKGVSDLLIFEPNENHKGLKKIRSATHQKNRKSLLQRL